MTDTRRDFLLRFAATALATAGAGCDMAPLATEPGPNVVYGPPPFRSSTSSQGAVQDFTDNIGTKVFFGTNLHALRTADKAVLDKQIAWLKAYPAYSITIEGHADERGTREYNLALSERRANSIVEYMKANGIPASRLQIIAFGKERPVALDSNETAWAQNRRGVTVLDR